MPIERRIEPGQAHRYPVALGPGLYVRVLAEQQAIDLSLALISPDGAEVERVDGPGGNWLEEALSTITRTAGGYRLEVLASTDAVDGGWYTLTLEDARAARPEDDLRVAADRAFHQGLHLRQAAEESSAKEALVLLRQAIGLYREIGDPAAEGRCWSEVGGTHLALGDLADSVDALSTALELARTSSDAGLEAWTLSQLGVALDATGEAIEAGKRHSLAADLARATADAGVLAGVLTNLGEFHYGQGRTEDALATLAEALGFARQARRRRDEAVVLLDLGAISRHLGRSRQALDFYGQALQLVRRLEDTQTELTLLNNLGVVYRTRGQIEEAREAYSRSLELSAIRGQRLTEAYASSNLGKLYVILGERERALALHERAFGLYREMGSLRGMARVQMEIGWMHELWGDTRAAVDSYLDALDKSKGARDQRTQAYTLEGLGRGYLAVGEPQRAAQHLGRALDLHRESGDLTGELGTQRELGQALQELAQTERASAALARSLELAELIGDPMREAATRSKLARFERSQGRAKAAREQIERALTAVESVRSELASPALRASYLSRRQNDYRFLVDLLVELDGSRPGAGLAALAFETSERARTRSLVELITESGLPIQRDISPALTERRVELTGRLSWLQRELIVRLSAAERADEDIAALRDELAIVRRNLELLDEEIRRRHPRYAEIRYPEPIAANRAMALLPADCALLEYVLGEERSFLFVLTRERLAVFHLPAETEITPRVRLMSELLRTPGRRSLARLEMLQRELFGVLIEPALTILEEKDKLLFAPDGALHYLPFEALRRSAPASAAAARAGPTADHLLQRWVVGYVPSATAVASIRSRDRPSPREAPARRFVAFADPSLIADDDPSAPTESIAARREADPTSWRPLPGARREVRSIAKLFDPESVTLFLGLDASEEEAKRNPAVRQAGILHFASHGVLDERQPMYSSLLLTPGPERREDGLLQAHEVFGLRLSADLVVLSACETALGKQVRGEGLVGLTRAFLYAGADAVLMSLWQVSDRSTADLMAAVYRHLAEGLSGAEALRQAKLELLESGRLSHPYYWAPFVLIGDID